MSMYSDLLASAWSKREGEPDSATLLTSLIAYRHQVDEAGFMGALIESTSTVAANIGYDLALLALCEERGIACNPRRFTQPMLERQRLEEALALRGLDVIALSRSS